MTQIKKITDKQGNDIYLRTHTKAVIDDNGYTAESRLQAMQDEINQAQLAVGAVPSDLTPTSGSSNWVTSGGVYNAVQSQNIKYDNSQSGLSSTNIQGALDDVGGKTNGFYSLSVIEKGLYIVDEHFNIGLSIDEEGAHCKNIIEYSIINE